MILNAWAGLRGGPAAYTLKPDESGEYNMTQQERLDCLIQELIKEQPRCRDVEIPESEQEKKRLLRSLMNLRPPIPAGERLLRVQDDYLREALSKKKVTSVRELTPVRERVYLWQGDITTLEAGAIVNAANSAMLGCVVPCHRCIDNAVHTYAGIQLRLFCARLMRKRKNGMATGQAALTPAFNLPCEYILHTVGPVISGEPDDEDCRLLASCYRSCLELAEQNHIKSVAFCCISTGEYHFPNALAAEIAVKTVTGYLSRAQTEIEVIFNVFKDADYAVYRSLLAAES